jgi:hypothetical protein
MKNLTLIAVLCLAAILGAFSTGAYGGDVSDNGAQLNNGINLQNGAQLTNGISAPENISLALMGLAARPLVRKD